MLTKTLAILKSTYSFCLKIFLAEPLKACVALAGLIIGITGLILAFAVAPVKISGDRADDFFQSYFSKVGEPNQRPELYSNDFTADYHRFESLKAYEDFWNLEGSATAWQAIPASGPLEFEVTLTFNPAGSAPSTETIDYYLKCTEILGAISARLHGCPINLNRSAFLRCGY